MTPPKLHMLLLELLSAGLPPISTVGEPGIQGAPAKDRCLFLSVQGKCVSSRYNPIPFYGIKMCSDEQTSTVVQPDLVVVCDKSKLDHRGCKGSPDLVVEITSPSTFQKDLKEKFILYERVGVREYWIVYPEENTISVFHLTNEGKYSRPEVYTEQDSIEIGIFDDLLIELSEVFA